MKDLQKRPSTSELLDWIQALMISGVSIDNLYEDMPFLGVLLKKNQDMDSTVLRLYEANGKDTAVDFALFGDKVKLNVNHNQIKTVNQNGDELDMMEWKK